MAAPNVAPAQHRLCGARCQLVLAAVRQHFRRTGGAPSHREIAAASGVLPRHVPRELDRLQRGGQLTYTRGKPRSIVLIDRCANFADDELVLALRSRGFVVTAGTPPVASTPA